MRGGGLVKKWHEGRERSKPGGKSKRSFYWKNQKNKFPGFNLAKKGSRLPREQDRVPDGKGLDSDVAKIFPK